MSNYLILHDIHICGAGLFIIMFIVFLCYETFVYSIIYYIFYCI